MMHRSGRILMMHRERAADRAVQRRKRGYPRGPESRPGLPRRSRLARSGPGAARAWIQVSARERGIPLLDGVFPARTGNPNRRHRLRHAPDLGLATGSMTIETAGRASLEFVCILGHDGQAPASPLPSASRNLTQPSCPRSPGRPIRQRLPDQQRMAQAPGGLLRFYHREAA